MAITKKSRIPETKNLLTDADSRTNTILERLRDFSEEKKMFRGGCGFLGLHARPYSVHAKMQTRSMLKNYMKREQTDGLTDITTL